MVLGCIVASATGLNPNQQTAYDNGIGFLVQYIIYPNGFAKFILVILALSGMSRLYIKWCGIFV